MSGGDKSPQDVEIENIKQGMEEIKITLREMAAAVLSIARSEERLANLYETVRSLTSRIGKIENSVSELERAKPINDQTNRWAERAVLVVIGAITMKALGIVLG